MPKYFTEIDRRSVCCSIAGSALNAVLAKPSFGNKRWLEMPTTDQFVIVNGWVLTREDIAAGEIAPNVV
jgi:hypothetical protein